jgi:hypothetical protein
MQCLIMNIAEILDKTEICTGQNYTFVHLKTTIDYSLVCESFCDCILLCKFLALTIHILHRITYRFIANVMCQLDDAKSILLNDHRC